MKFKARLHNVDLFSKLVQAVEKIGKQGTLLLTPKKVQLILTSDITDGVQVWCGLNTGSIFADAIVESLHENQISLEVNLDLLQRALKSASAASTQEVVMKLTKKNNCPFLTLLVEIQGTQSLSITQDVPIVLISATQFAQLTEPHLPDPTVHILLPPLRLLHNVVERLKNISDFLILHANMNGELNLRAETDVVSICTHYKQLEHPQIEGRSPPRPDAAVEAELKVDVKKFARFLYAYNVMPTNVICCMVKDRALVLHVLLDDLYLTYYIPVVVVHH